MVLLEILLVPKTLREIVKYATTSLSVDIYKYVFVIFLSSKDIALFLSLRKLSKSLFLEHLKVWHKSLTKSLSYSSRSDESATKVREP